MILVMGASMASRSALATLAGAALLIVVAVVCAAFSRSHRFLQAHVLDLWAMALVMIALVQHGGVDGHHSLAVPGMTGVAIVVAAWSLARLALARRRGAGRADAASASLTAAGLLVMAVFCA